MAVDAVVFDWGGTLSTYADIADMADMWRLAARHLVESHGLPADREAEVCARLVEVEDASWQRVHDDQSPTTLAELLAAASDAIGLDVAEAVLAETATRYLDSWTPHIAHDPDAAPVLAALRQRGLPIGLLSNTHWPREFHERFLERDGLAHLIDVRCYTSEMARTKPHRDAFLHVLGALGVDDPRRAVFVGDRPFDDVHGAQQAGMRGVLRPHPAIPPFPVEPDAEITSLWELVDHVDRWRAEP